jgi:hypothetical protein
VENHAIELLERQVGRLENYPAMAERMRRHIAESIRSFVALRFRGTGARQAGKGCMITNV